MTGTTIAKKEVKCPFVANVETSRVGMKVPVGWLAPCQSMTLPRFGSSRLPGCEGIAKPLLVHPVPHAKEPP